MRTMLSDKRLQEAFKLFDKVISYLTFQDNSGSITASEIKDVLGVGRKVGDEKVWDTLIAEIDVNGDGEISFDEFKVMMTKFLSTNI